MIRCIFLLLLPLLLNSCILVEADASWQEKLSWQMNDYYGALGVRKNVTKREIKKAFRTLSLQFHPDKFKDHINNADVSVEAAEKRFLGLAEAYEVLKDEVKRKEYDAIIESLPSSFRPRFGESRLVRIDAWGVVLAFLFVLSTVQFYGQTYKYNQFVKYWKTKEDVRMFAKGEIQAELRKKSIKKNGKPLSSRRLKDIENELIEAYLEEKSKKLNVQGGYKKIELTDLVIIKFLKLPYSLPMEIYTWFSYFYRLSTGNYSLVDKIYWTRSRLRKHQDEWLEIPEEERKALLSKELWIDANYKRHVEEEIAEETKKNPARMKQW
eukprot:Stramenopile-MAST_4_protein_2749